MLKYWKSWLEKEIIIWRMNYIYFDSLRFTMREL